MIALAENDTRRELLVKQSKTERVLHLFVKEHWSTWSIARHLNMPEAEVCALIDESGWGR